LAVTTLTPRALATRAKLLDAAFREIARHGYEGATVDSIAERAGVSKGAFYGHFPSKDAAFEDVVREQCEARRRQLREACEAELDQGRSAMAVGFAAGFATALEDPDWPKFFLEHARFAERDAGAAAVHAAEYAAWADLIAELLDRSRGLGLLDFEGEARAVARVLMAVVDGFSIQAIIDPESVRQEEVAPMVAHLFSRALGGAEGA
jgi:AcrR family transcriptional regulator